MKASGVAGLDAIRGVLSASAETPAKLPTVDRALTVNSTGLPENAVKRLRSASRVSDAGVR